MNLTNKALFLDRDGVINVDHGYVHKIRDIKFIENIFNLCQHAQSKGYLIIIVTNQSGLARKYYSVQEFEQLSKWIENQFWKKGVKVSQTLYCPHHPLHNLNCCCRKPRPGMITKAIRRFNINPKLSIMIGDKHSDMLAARRAKIGKQILFKQGGKKFSPQLSKTQYQGNYHARSLSSIQTIL